MLAQLKRPHIHSLQSSTTGTSRARHLAALFCRQQTMAVTAQITHVIFDMDGLLLDTETFYTIAQKDICEKHGKQFSWDLKAKMMGKKALDAAQVLIDELGLHDVLTPEQFLKQREEILDRLFPTSPLMPGVEALIRHLYAHKIPIAVATSSHRRHFDIKTQQHKELFKLFNHIITGDQVSKGKPDPEIFERAAAGFDLPPASPAHCLVFEDAPTGVKAALAAGMNVIMVPDPNLSRDHIDGLGAAALLKSLQQFDPNKWGLPSLEVDVQTPAGTDSLQAGIVVN